MASNFIWNAGTLYLSMTVRVPIPYMECGNLVTVNDLWSPIPYMDGRDLITINDLWSPITYMECGNLVTVNDLWSPYLIWIVGVLYLSMTCGPHTLYGMWEPCNCQWLMVPQTLYGMWEPCIHSMTVMVPKPYMECRNLLSVNDFGPPYLIWMVGTL